jgi:hypothetical protein
LHPERRGDQRRELKIARRPVGRGEVIALPVAAGTEGAEAAEDDASRYSARYSPRKDEGSHTKSCRTRGCQARAC